VKSYVIGLLPALKLVDRDSWFIAESGVKHQKSNQIITDRNYLPRSTVYFHNQRTPELYTL